jgi:hypothetical protein
MLSHPFRRLMRHQAERDQVLAVALHWCVFSGGMDQSVLAALSHRLQTELKDRHLRERMLLRGMKMLVCRRFKLSRVAIADDRCQAIVFETRITSYTLSPSCSSSLDRPPA